MKKPLKRGRPTAVREPARQLYTASEPSVKKNIRLHQSKIDAARKALGTSTETETIETALDLVVFRKELVEGARSMRGAQLVNYFDE